MDDLCKMAELNAEDNNPKPKAKKCGKHEKQDNNDSGFQQLLKRKSRDESDDDVSEEMLENDDMESNESSVVHQSLQKKKKKKKKGPKKICFEKESDDKLQSSIEVLTPSKRGRPQKTSSSPTNYASPSSTISNRLCSSQQKMPSSILRKKKSPKEKQCEEKYKDDSK